MEWVTAVRGRPPPQPADTKLDCQCALPPTPVHRICHMRCDPSKYSLKALASQAPLRYERSWMDGILLFVLGGRAAKSGLPRAAPSLPKHLITFIRRRHLHPATNTSLFYSPKRRSVYSVLAADGNALSRPKLANARACAMVAEHEIRLRFDRARAESWQTPC